jgi:hypothetical protein
MSEATEALSTATDELLARLRASPTDLRKLVGAVLRRDCRVVGISGAAIGRWGRDDLESWTTVREWLESRGVRIVVAGAPHADLGRPDPTRPRHNGGAAVGPP